MPNDNSKKLIFGALIGSLLMSFSIFAPNSGMCTYLNSDDNSVVIDFAMDINIDININDLDFYSINQYDLSQERQSNLSIINQFGFYNEAYQTQIGSRNLALIYQKGHGNTALQYQVGYDNKALAIQIGDRNSAIQHQVSSGNFAIIYQLGVGNYAEQYQGGAGGFRSVIIQQGNNNWARVTQY